MDDTKGARRILPLLTSPSSVRVSPAQKIPATKSIIALTTGNSVCENMCTKQKVLLLAIRQALIISIGAIEDYLSMPRSIVPKHSKTMNAER